MLNIPGVQLYVADFDPRAIWSVTLYGGPRSVSGHCCAPWLWGARARSGEKGHAALLPALPVPLVTAGAGWEQGVLRECGTLGWSLRACLCLSQVCRL